MATHMAFWHQLRGGAAGLCLAAAESTRESLGESTLLRVLLERSVGMARGGLASQTSPSPPPRALGDPLRRQYIKSKFFVEVEAPLGRDLALLLDLTEAALLALEAAMGPLPSDARLREDDLAGGLRPRRAVPRLHPAQRAARSRRAQ